MPWDRTSDAAFDEQVGSLPDATIVIDRYLDIVAANPLAEALSGALTVGSNLARSMFLDPVLHVAVDDWEHHAAVTVAALRGEVRAHPADRRYVDVVGELMTRSSWFVGDWVRTPLAVPPTSVIAFEHPTVGALTLRFVRLRRPSDEYVFVMWTGANRASIVALHQLSRLISQTPTSTTS